VLYRPRGLPQPQQCRQCCYPSSPGALYNACQDGQTHCLSPGHTAHTRSDTGCEYQCPDGSLGNHNLCGYQGEGRCCAGTVHPDNGCNHCCGAGQIWCTVQGGSGVCFMGSGARGPFRRSFAPPNARAWAWRVARRAVCPGDIVEGAAGAVKEINADLSPAVDTTLKIAGAVVGL